MADIREQDLALKTTIADTDWIRLVTATGNHRMTVGQFKDLIGYTQAKSDISQLQTDVAGMVTRGSNENGNWIKFADGTQICHNKITYTSDAVNNPHGSSFMGNSKTITFPTPFIGEPTVVPSVVGGLSYMSCSLVGVDKSYFVARFVSPITISSASNTVHYIATGRWK